MTVAPTASAALPIAFRLRLHGSIAPDFRARRSRRGLRRLRTRRTLIRTAVSGRSRLSALALSPLPLGLVATVRAILACGAIRSAPMRFMLSIARSPVMPVALR